MEYQKNQSECGKKGNVLVPTGGRVAQLIYTQSKVLTTAVFERHFSCIADNYPDSIVQFQVHQISIKLFKIFFVRGIKFQPDVLNVLENELKTVFTEEELVFIPVSKIPASESGKTQIFIPN